MRFLAFLRRPKPWGDQIPTAVGEIRGYRCWAVEFEGGKPWLRSYYAHTRWIPEHVLQAVCHRDQAAFRGMGADHEGEPAPAASCTCGIYALADPADPELRRLLGGSPQYGQVATVVGGQVALWGRVRVGEKGWRAEFARPIRLWWDPDRAQEGVVRALAERYRVPAGPLPWKEER